MRKLLSVGALLAASTLGLVSPAMAHHREEVVVIRPHYHHHHYRVHYRYYDYWR